MVKQYTIVGFGKTGKFLDFSDAILVKVVSSDEIDYYEDIKDDRSYEEEKMQCEHWLVFKNYPGKYQWITEKAYRCEDGDVWYLDISKDFVKRSMSLTDNTTGESFIRPICQVVLVNPNMDAVEAKEKGKAYKGRNGVQKHLDELGLPLEGKDIKYYVIGQGKDGELFGIPYDYNEDYNGHFYCDEIAINPFNGGVSLKKRKVGIYNPMLRQFMKFAH